VIFGFIVVWLFMHRAVAGSDSMSPRGGLSASTTVTTQNILRLQRLMDDSKALLDEIKSSNVTVSSHTLHELSRVEEGRSVVAEELLSVKHRFVEAQREIARYKDLLALHKEESEREKGKEKGMAHAVAGGGASEAAEMREHLLGCQQQLLHALSQPGGSAAGGAVLEGQVGDSTWLFIGIPTVSRSANEDYLLQTLASIRRQLPTDPDDLLFRRVKVLVLNIEGPSHKRFYEAQVMFAGGGKHGAGNVAPAAIHGAHHSRRLQPGASPTGAHNYFEFVTLSEEYKAESASFQDPKKGATAQSDQGNANVPGFKVRKQTRSIAEVLKRAQGRAKYYMFLEDDMVLCPHGFNSIHYLLSKASKYSPDWLAIRASYGMNGVFIHDKDISHFYNYLIANQSRRPPDHLAVEWFAGESKVSAKHKNGRAHMAYRFNLFDHIGISSTLRKGKQTTFPRCYEFLGVPTLFEVEAFNPRQCPADDIWPCNAHSRRDLDSDRAIVQWIPSKHQHL